MSYHRELTRAAVDAADDSDLFPEPRTIELACTVQHRGRSITITARGYTADELCDLLDRRFGEPAGQVSDTARLPALPNDGPPVCTNRNCSRYHQPMAPSKFGGWHCSGKDSISGNSRGYCRETS